MQTPPTAKTAETKNTPYASTAAHTSGATKQPIITPKQDTCMTQKRCLPALPMCIISLPLPVLW